MPPAGTRYPLAAPSWVFPGSLRDNAVFLEGRVDEVGLLFMETASCLAYGAEALPLDLALLDLSWHVHLPCDLPWAQGGSLAADAALALMDKVAFLGAVRAVVHPPPESPTAWRAMAAFLAAWRFAGRNAGDILLENTRENDLCLLLPWIGEEGVGICADLGHILAYGQFDFLNSLPGRARLRMVHLSASGRAGENNGGSHLPLDTLDEEGLCTALALCASLADDGVVMVELFAWEHITRSLPVVARLFGDATLYERS